MKNDLPEAALGAVVSGDATADERARVEADPSARVEAAELGAFLARLRAHAPELYAERPEDRRGMVIPFPRRGAYALAGLAAAAALLVVVVRDVPTTTAPAPPASSTPTRPPESGDGGLRPPSTPPAGPTTPLADAPKAAAPAKRPTLADLDPAALAAIAPPADPFEALGGVRPAAVEAALAADLTETAVAEALPPECDIACLIQELDDDEADAVFDRLGREIETMEGHG